MTKTEVEILAQVMRIKFEMDSLKAENKRLKEELKECKDRPYKY